MADRPIIFSVPMVRALLDGRKTQTRRLATSPLAKARPGDRLWVRETWAKTTNVNGQAPWPDRPHTKTSDDGLEVAIYGADGTWQWFDDDGFSTERSCWRPSIHMPRWASRITLIVEAVKVEPMNAISEDDAVAEGVKVMTQEGGRFYGLYSVCLPSGKTYYSASSYDAFRRLWGDLHGPDAWSDNPVVAITFRVVTANIDSLLKDTLNAG